MQHTQNHDSEQGGLRSALKEFYKKRYPEAQESNANQFAKIIMVMLDEINDYYGRQGKPLTLLTGSYNLQDGIGDYVNQADFSAWLYEVVDRYKNIRVQSISVVEEKKFALAQRLMPENVKRHGVLMIRTPDDIPDSHTSDMDNIFISYEAAMAGLNSKLCRNIINNSEFLMILARYLHFHKETEMMLDQVKPETMVQSRGEYGPVLNEPYLYWDYDSGKPLERKLYYETCMGAAEETTGMKFYNDLMDLCQRTRTVKEKSELLRQMENQQLYSVASGGDPDTFMDRQGFAFGYIQDKKYSLLFTRLMMAKSADKPEGLTMVVNLSHFEDMENDENLMKQLRDNGYESVRLLRNDGSVANSISVNPENTSGAGPEESGKVLTLIEFRGTSQADKEKLIALSDMVAGSGNSSFSEMISSGRFPFIQPIFHVQMFYLSFINEIDKHDIEHGDLLKQYLLLNIKQPLTETDVDELTRMVCDDEISSKVLIAWRQYGMYLEQNKNAYDDFLGMVIAFVIQKGLEIEPSLLDSLVEVMPPNAVLSGYSLVHICIEKNLTTVLDKFLREHPETVNIQCGYKNYTPLMMAARYKHYDMIKLLLNAGANIYLPDQDGLTVVHHAAINKDYKLLKILYANNINLDQINDKEGRSVLNYILNSNDFAFIKEYLQATGRRHDVLYIAELAVEHENVSLFETCCRQASANPDKLRTIALKASDPNMFISRHLAVFGKEVNDKIFYQELLPPDLRRVITNPSNDINLRHIDKLSFQIQLLSIARLVKQHCALDTGSIDVKKVPVLLSDLMMPGYLSYLYKQCPTENHEPLFKIIWKLYETQLVRLSKAKICSPEDLSGFQRKLMMSKLEFYLDEFNNKYIAGASKLTLFESLSKRLQRPHFSHKTKSEKKDCVFEQLTPEHLNAMKDELRKCSRTEEMIAHLSKQDPKLLAFLMERIPEISKSELSLITRPPI